jgi:uncharacterized protein
MNDPILKEIVSRLSKEFHPSKMYLFGSRASGHAQPDSDYDLLLVVKGIDSGKFERMKRARRALQGLDMTADVFVYSEEEFNEWKDELSSIPETALREGLELEVG